MGCINNWNLTILFGLIVRFGQCEEYVWSKMLYVMNYSLGSLRGWNQMIPLLPREQYRKDVSN